MSKLSKILWKIFTGIAVFSCYDSVNAAAQNSADIYTLCRAGYYVSKCGNYTVGTNWLKGYPASENEVLVNNTARSGVSYSNIISGGTNSPNYYDYSGENNLVNLRKFFSDGNNTMVYTTSSGTMQTSANTEYVPHRNNLLIATCNPTRVQIVCAQCPGIANVPASTVNINYDSGLLVANSWNFHTIADCYMQEFADSTGIFEYVDDNTNPPSPQNCYYTKDFAGDVLIKEGAMNPSQYNER